MSITTPITASGVSINRLEDMGVSLIVPESSISSSCEHIDLHIRPCFSGPFKLPPGYESASPVYLISPSRKINFLKDVIVRIYHNICLLSEEDCEDMAFFSASFKQHDSDKQPVYTFKKMDGTNTRFRRREQVGEISLRHFCAVKIERRKRSSPVKGAVRLSHCLSTNCTNYRKSTLLFCKSVPNYTAQGEPDCYILYVPAFSTTHEGTYIQL